MLLRKTTVCWSPHSSDGVFSEIISVLKSLSLLDTVELTFVLDDGVVFYTASTVQYSDPFSSRLSSLLCWVVSSTIDYVLFSIGGSIVVGLL